MSKDVISPLMNAVADLPVHHTGLVLGIINALRGQDAQEVAERLKQALVLTVQKVGESSLITFTAPVNRTITPKEALLATGRKLYLNEDVVANWPASATGETVTMSFYRFGQFFIEAAKLDEELAELGLELVVDPTGLAAINQAHPDFADTHPNGTQWKNAAGKICSAVFDRWSDGRHVYVSQDGLGWDGAFWWFPVRRIQTS